MSYILLGLTGIFFLIYFRLVIYPDFFKPIDLNVNFENRKLLLLTIKSKVTELSMDSWEKIKNNENPLIFIYLYQLSSNQIRRKVNKNLNLSFDPMASKKMIKPSNQTLKFIKDYLCQ